MEIVYLSSLILDVASPFVSLRISEWYVSCHFWVFAEKKLLTHTLLLLLLFTGFFFQARGIKIWVFIHARDKRTVQHRAGLRLETAATAVWERRETSTVRARHCETNNWRQAGRRRFFVASEFAAAAVVGK